MPMQEEVLQVEGMVSAWCVQRIEHALAHVPGVHDARVNLVTEKAIVHFDPALASESQLEAAVLHAGYEVGHGQPRPVTHHELLQVVGLSCARCVQRVESALTRVPGVLDASVDPATQQASVHFDSTFATRGQLEKAVVQAGYGVLQGVVAEVEVPALTPTRSPAGRGSQDLELRRDARLAVLLTLPLLVLSLSHGLIPWADGPSGQVAQWLLASPLLFGPGRRFLLLAWKAARRRSINLNTLIVLATLPAWAWSTVAALFPQLFPRLVHGAPLRLYFEALAIITFVLLGQLLEARVGQRVSEAVPGLGSLMPRLTTRLQHGVELQVKVSSLRPGDLVRVHPGERLPADGEVAGGSSAVDEAMLSGERAPVEKGRGDPVSGGTLNTRGSLTVRVSRTGARTALSRLVQGVESAQGTRAPVSRAVDEFAVVFVPVVAGLALLTFGVWWVANPTAVGFASALQHLVAVLVFSCPAALGLAAPAAVAVATARGAELGVLVRGGAVLEALNRVRVVLLDKTGTVSAGQPALTDVVALGDQAALLRRVAAVERLSGTPLGQALVAGAERRLHEHVAPAPGVLVSEPGEGVEANGVRIGTRAWLREAGIDPTPLEEQADALALQGRVPSFVGDVPSRTLLGLVAVMDAALPQAKEAVTALQFLGLEVVLLTGDGRRLAEAVGRALGISRIEAEVRPEAKAELVAKFRKPGRLLAMVGDGVNDAPALARADVGVAIGGGPGEAVGSGDVVVLRGGISALPLVVGLARATVHLIRLNVFWAIFANALCLPLAAGVLVPAFGLDLAQGFGGVALSVSCVAVLANALRLRRYGKGAVRLEAPRAPFSGSLRGPPVPAS